MTLRNQSKNHPVCLSVQFHISCQNQVKEIDNYILAILAHLVPYPTKNNSNEVPFILLQLIVTSETTPAHAPAISLVNTIFIWEYN